LAELSSLKAEVAAQRDSIHRLMESIMSGEAPGQAKIKRLDSDEEALALLEGVWKDLESGSVFYAKSYHGRLRCIYCYGDGNDLPTGEFYDWKLVDRTALARFRWFNDKISGYGYVRVEAQDRLSGEWWMSVNSAAVGQLQIGPDMASTDFGLGLAALHEFEDVYQTKPGVALELAEKLSRAGIGVAMRWVRQRAAVIPDRVEKAFDEYRAGPTKR
jgi:hypothetical protein